jgi:hypothetical protein
MASGPDEDRVTNFEFLSRHDAIEE